MEITINISEQLEAGLKNLADLRKMQLREYIEHVLRSMVPESYDHTLTPAERAKAWREAWRDIPRTPVLSDEAMSRESIYADDDDRVR